ncbi:MAG: hypothetical protein ACLUFV_11655 [Acutalibacteraceae bacterium]
MLLTAIVREVRPSGLLVRDTSNGQDVFVRTAMRAGIVRATASSFFSTA